MTKNGIYARPPTWTATGVLARPTYMEGEREKLSPYLHIKRIGKKIRLRKKLEKVIVFFLTKIEQKLKPAFFQKVRFS
jgi:hypothetical protein